ncbi:MAG TPA: hypothetical protein VEX67_18475 [Solirubrobacteraceae bacterium]|nr:hypothetical protein [Solirubrobacteraceae bacterium]
MRSRGALFALVAVACTLGAAAAVISAVAQQTTTPEAGVRSAALARPYVVFRSLDPDVGEGHLGELTSTPAAAPGRTRRPSGRLCERVYASATGGICIARTRSLLGAFEAQVLAADGRVRHKVDLAGIPSRARVSADGRYGATTTFVTGHSYAAAGEFSTQTLLIDMRRGETIADLESFTVSRAGRVVDAADVQFWGVTFARDSDRFYATLATAGKTYLIAGRVSTRTARVIHDNVECPSLSPDGTRIGYKKLVGKKGQTWRFHVLDLASGVETPLAETRSVDDQLEWLDDANLLYRAGDAIWSVRADGTGAPRRYLAHADSPAVVR